jgi:hypothetical protein
MSGLYQWHTAFVAVFLGFVVVFVIWSGIRGQGSGKK